MKGRFRPILLILLLVLLSGAFGVYRYVYKPVTDYGARPADSVFSFEAMMIKVTDDTASLNKLKDQVVGIRGLVKTMRRADSSLTVEIGTDSSASSVVCQIDTRYMNDFQSLQTGQNIAIQGRVVGYTIDSLFGLGNTVEMNYCSILQDKN